MSCNAMTEHYEEISVCGKPALFTSFRIKEIPSRMVYMPTMCGMMMTAGGFPVRLHHLSWSITGERLFLQSRWSCPMTDGGTLMKRRTGTMIRLEEQRKIKSPA